MWNRRWLVILPLCYLVSTCALPPKDDLVGDTAPSAAVETKPARISLHLQDTNLGNVVRLIGETHSGSIALTNGIESRRIDTLRFQRTKFQSAVERIAQHTGCLLHTCPRYFFIYPPGYENLADLSLAGQLDTAYAEYRPAIVFGAGTTLDTALMWISQALDITIVADNMLAEARCGELTLEPMPLQDGLEAILKSARVIRVNIASTDEYIFLRASNDKPLTTALLNNADSLDKAQHRLLNTRVNVYLPERPREPTPLQIPSGPKPLQETLRSLSKQLGIDVRAEPELEDFPVNPAVFNNVRVKTALDLLIWQWPVPKFGYRVSADHILICRRPKDS